LVIDPSEPQMAAKSPNCLLDWGIKLHDEAGLCAIWKFDKQDRLITRLKGKTQDPLWLANPVLLILFGYWSLCMYLRMLESKTAMSFSDWGIRLPKEAGQISPPKFR